MGKADDKLGYTYVDDNRHEVGNVNVTDNDGSFLDEESNSLDSNLVNHREIDIDAKKRRPNHASRRVRKIRQRNMQSNEMQLQTDDYGLSQCTRRDATLTNEVLGEVVSQLGYLPVNIVRVGAYFQDMPSVVVLYPLNTNSLRGRYNEKEGEKPFPTIYWMTSPILHAQISRLEKSGWIKTFQARLKDEENHAEDIKQMKTAHREYAQERWKLLSEEDKVFVVEKGWYSSLYIDIIYCHLYLQFFI